MIRSRYTLHVATACAASLAILECQFVQATVLPFEMTPYPGFVLGGFESTYSTYGDNVSATTGAGPGTTYNYAMGNGFTPDITVDYSHSALPAGNGGHSLSATQGNWSDPVDYLHYQDTTLFWYTFTPTAPFGVDINSFSIDLYAGAMGSLNWKLRQGSTVGPIFASGVESSMVATDPDRLVTIANGSFYGTVVLQIDFTGTGNVGNIGIDDLNFDQLAPPVPEPSTFALFGLGVVGLAIKSRRRRQAA